MAWRSLSKDPNSIEAVSARRAALDQAASSTTIERIDVIDELGRGRRVVDVGCVDHFAESAANPSWLHRHLVDIAEEVVGVDIEVDGVNAMVSAGYDAVVHDITSGVGPLADRVPFDVVVAGELIEHLDRPRAIFEFARDVLRPGGHLVITTPNPYCWRRVRAGQKFITWENVDHVVYVPPTGVIEMAERTGGLRLERFGSSAEPAIRSPLRSFGGFVKRTIRNGYGFWEGNLGAVTPAEILSSISRPAVMRGETVTYVLVRT